MIGFVLCLLFALCGSSMANVHPDGPPGGRGRGHHSLTEPPKRMSSEKAEHGHRQSQRLIGRHVCTHNKVVMHPVKDMQSYCKPSYRSYLKRCDNDSSRICTGYRVAYEVAYRTVQRFLAKTESIYSCCPGWTLSRTTATDCKKAICKEECRNGGVCTKPDRCTCPAGWTGRACETDVDECATAKEVCQHSCVNIPGSYRCECEVQYTLQPDKKSCRSKDFNASDMAYSTVIDTQCCIGRKAKAVETSEGDNLTERIKVLEKRMVRLDELNSRLDSLSDSIEQVLSKKSKDADKDGGNETKSQTKDQIDSLSDQIAILEERLAECTCNKKEELHLPRTQR